MNMRKILAFALAFCILVLFLCAAGAAFMYYIDTPVHSAGNPVPFSINEGESLSSVARRLEENDLIRCAKFLVVL